MTKLLNGIRTLPHILLSTHTVARSCIGAMVVGLTCSLPAHADHPDPLPNSFFTSTFGYRLGYTSQNPYNCSTEPQADDDGNFVPDDVAHDMADALDRGGSGSPGNPPGYHLGYTNLGFHTPDFADNQPPRTSPMTTATTST